MPRVTHVKKARKDNSAVKAGEPYFWWKFAYSPKRYSATRPRASQLTQSAYFGALHGMQENIEDTELNNDDDAESLAEEINSQIEELTSETQESLDNMPESLQYSPTGELLQERIDALGSVESEMVVSGGYDPECDDLEEWASDVKQTMSDAIDQAFV
jgi:hypothetical protein